MSGMVGSFPGMYGVVLQPTFIIVLYTLVATPHGFVSPSNVNHPGPISIRGGSGADRGGRGGSTGGRSIRRRRAFVDRRNAGRNHRCIRRTFIVHSLLHPLSHPLVVFTSDLGGFRIRTRLLFNS